MSASIGVARYPTDGDTGEEILKKADSAMYAAKKAGRNCWRFYEPLLMEEAFTKMVLTNGLRRALEREELYLQYQPQIALASGQVVGFEALLRWQSQEYGAVSPLQFIPLAEHSGLILSIGQWVVEEACRFARRLADAGRDDILVSVNISPKQLMGQGFVRHIRSSLDQAGIKAQQLEMEVTESLLIESMNESVQHLTWLRELGVGLALDDFGTGYSSLTYLLNLPVKTLKIDKSFIDNITSDPAQLEMVGSIIRMGHVLGLTIVAEGVETAQQQELLRLQRCDRIQGYIFSKPVEEAEALRFVTSQGTGAKEA